jgi:hypothetical protein
MTFCEPCSLVSCYTFSDLQPTTHEKRKGKLMTILTLILAVVLAVIVMLCVYILARWRGEIELREYAVEDREALLHAFESMLSTGIHFRVGKRDARSLRPLIRERARVYLQALIDEAMTQESNARGVSRTPPGKRFTEKELDTLEKDAGACIHDSRGDNFGGTQRSIDGATIDSVSREPLG